MTTILITGGAGFIGSSFIFRTLKKHPDCRVVCFDKLTYAGNLASLEPVLGLPRFRFVHADICDRDAVQRVFAEEKPEIVVNFAAESHVDRSIEEPELFLKTNLLGVSALMDGCVQSGVRRFHQVSSDEVYGDLPLDRPDLLFREDAPLRASSPYSASKASADLLALAYHRTYGLPVTVSRCANNFGPRQFPEKLIPRMIANALSDRPLPVYGDGCNVRDWLHVDDHCTAIDRILQKGTPGMVYNIGARCELRNIELVRMICRALGKPESLIEYVPDRKGHDRRYGVDPSKIRRELGWHAETDFAEGLQRTIRWYAENRSWWEPILSGAYRAQNALLLERMLK